MTANEPYRLEQTIARVSQAFDLGCRNGPFRPENRAQLFSASLLKSWTIPQGKSAACFCSCDSIVRSSCGTGF